MIYTLEAAAPTNHRLPSSGHISLFPTLHSALAEQFGAWGTAWSPQCHLAVPQRGPPPAVPGFGHHPPLAVPEEPGAAQPFPAAGAGGLLIKIWDKLGGAPLLLGDVARCW